MRDWSFAHRPRWLASHLFVGSLIVVFIWAGFWQLSRLDQRRTQNETILDRSTAQPVSVAAALDRHPDSKELDYVAVSDRGRYLDGEVVRVVNRSQNGLGGDWVVGLFETVAGEVILVNRGFAGRDEAAIDPPPGEHVITGWLRISQTKDGFFGAADTGEGDRVPRLDVRAIAARLDRSVSPVWLQADGDATAEPPNPVPLPPISEGSHLSYAMQWFIFALLGVVVYGLVLRRKAGQRAAGAGSNPGQEAEMATEERTRRC